MTTFAVELNRTCVECGAEADPKVSRRGFGFCSECHSKVLDGVRNSFGTSLRTKSAVGAPRRDADAMEAGAEHRRQREAERRREDAKKVADVSSFIHAARQWPVKRADLSAKFSNKKGLDRALRLAVESGHVTLVKGGRIAGRGYYPARASEQDSQQPLAA